MNFVILKLQQKRKRKRKTFNRATIKIDHDADDDHVI